MRLPETSDSQHWYSDHNAPRLPACSLRDSVWAWAGDKLGNVDPSSSNDGRVQPAKTWGATTLVFMRDSRNARIVSLLETVGCFAIFGVIGIYWFGLYPVTMNLRVVGEIDSQGPVAQEEIQKSIEARSNGVDVQIAFKPNGSLVVRSWQFQQKNFLEQLALPQAPVLRSVIGPEKEHAQTESSYLPVLSGVPIDEVSNRNTSSGPEVLCETPI